MAILRLPLKLWDFLTRLDIGDRALAYVLIFPSAFLIFLFAIYPALQGLWVSLFRVDAATYEMSFNGISNYTRLFADERFWEATWRTLWFVTTSNVIQLVLGLGIALLVHQELFGRNFVRGIVLFPYLVPAIVIALTWRYMLDPTQMMSGLAYMTGPPGQPLRAGASIIDIMSATYGVVGILAALRERERTGTGQLVQNGLFETATYLVGQHLAASATMDADIHPFPGRVRSWAIYKLFEAADGKKVFVGVTSDKHWQRFCEVFDRADLYADDTLVTNNQRYEAAARLLPDLEAMFRTLPHQEILRRCEEAGIPHAPVNRVEDLWDDPHLIQTGALLSTNFPHHDVTASLPGQPLRFDGKAHGIRQQPPQVGEHTRDLLQAVGYSLEQLDMFIDEQIIAAQ